MPEPFGVIPTGFSLPTLEELRDKVSQRLRIKFGAGIDVSDESVEGMVAAILSESLAVAWEALEGLYFALSRDTARDNLLSAIALLTGTIRKQPAQSRVTMTLTGDDTTVVPAESRVAAVSTATEWATEEDVTLEQLTAFTPSGSYTVGQRVTNVGRSYECITSGTSSVNGPTTTAADITDGTVHWTYLGEGEAAGDVDALSVDFGPIVGTARDLTSIVTPVSGWESAINLENAAPGRDLESDKALRLRSEADLSRLGSTTVDALRSELLDVEGVSSASIFVNNTDEDLEVDTAPSVILPPHTVEAVVRGGADQDIWDALLAGVAAGIGTYGDEEGTAEDSEGVDHTMRFSRPTEINVWVEVDLEYDEDLYPDDGDDQVTQAILDYGNAQQTGRDADASALIAQVFAIDGVLRITDLFVDDNASPVTTAVTINRHSLAVYDAARITINSTIGTP